MVMNKVAAISRKAITLLVASLLLSVSSAYAQDWKAVGYFGWFGVGKGHQIEEGRVYWVGEFSGTFFSDEGSGGLFHLAGVKCPAWFELDFNQDRAKAGGHCVITDIDGDQAYVKWENAGNSTKTGTPLRGTFEYTGGTGKYAGISGRSRFTGIRMVDWADGTASGYSTWGR